MSSFLSRKYLELRNAQLRTRTIDDDCYCVTCGYNLRGLSFGRNCPECGRMIKPPSTRIDGLLSGDESQRQRIKIGLTLITACLFIASGAALALFIALSLLGNPYAFDAYLWLGLILCLAWIAGVCLLTGHQFKSRYGKLNWLRRASRWMAFLWLPGHALWMWSSIWNAGSLSADGVELLSFLIRAAAGVGGILFATWLMQLADDAELEDAARRINLAIWMLPLPTLLLAMLPDQVPWIFLALIGMVLLVWCWFVAMMGRGALAMQRHVSWGLRVAAEAADRDTRVTQKRAELQRETDARVRPVPGQPDADISLHRLKS
jgi:hypothetical protein